jgi:PTH1 family peptidyl-tRNA hydrolase
MKLIVGLGNPGKEYAGTRHNMGYLTLDRFADMANGSFDHSGFRGVYGIVKNPDLPEGVIIAKPETFMNLSGEFVRPLADYFKIPVEDIIVVYDDMALPEGAIRLREMGSSGGHKGIQNIIDNFKSPAIKRIRIGIGEPLHTGVDWVLSKPTGESKDRIDAAIDNAAKALRDILIHGFPYAMSVYNGQGGSNG